MVCHKVAHAVMYRCVNKAVRFDFIIFILSILDLSEFYSAVTSKLAQVEQRRYIFISYVCLCS